MTAASIIWNSLDLGLLGKPKLKISRQPDPPSPSMPTRMLVDISLTVELESWDPATILARAEHIATSLKISEGILEVNNNHGKAYSWLATPGQNNLAEVITGNSNRMEISFSAAENYESLTSIDSASFTPIGGSPITLHAVRDFKEEIRSSRHSDRNGARNLTTRSFSFTARIAQADPAELATARLAFLQTQANAIRGLNAREGTLTYGSLAGILVKVQDFAPVIDDRKGVLDVTVQCVNHTMPHDGTAECLYETSSKMEEEGPHEVIEISGTISAQTRAIAEAKLLDLLNAEKNKAGQRVVGHTKADRVIDGYDSSASGNTWTGEMTYTIQVLKRREDFRMVERTETKDETNGEIVVSIRGEIMAESKQIAETKLLEYLEQLSAVEGQRITSHSNTVKDINGKDILGYPGQNEWVGTLGFTVEIRRKMEDFLIIEKTLSMDEANGEISISIKGEIIAITKEQAESKFNEYLTALDTLPEQRVMSYNSTVKDKIGDDLVTNDESTEWLGTLSFTVEIRKRRQDFRITDTTTTQDESNAEITISIKGEIMELTREQAESKLKQYLQEINTIPGQRVTNHSSTVKNVDGKDMVTDQVGSEWLGTLSFTAEIRKARQDFLVTETTTSAEETNGEITISIKGEISADTKEQAISKFEQYIQTLHSTSGQRVSSFNHTSKDITGNDILDESGEQWLGTLGFTVEVRKRRVDLQIYDVTESTEENSTEKSISIKGEIMAPTKQEAHDKFKSYIESLKTPKRRITNYTSNEKNLLGKDIATDAAQDTWIGTLSFTVEMKERRPDHGNKEITPSFENGIGEESISIRGEISAETEDEARSRFNDILNEQIDKPDQRVVSYNSTIKRIDGTDSMDEALADDGWTGTLSYQIEIKKRREAGHGTRKITSQKDIRGITKWNYSGTIWAESINKAKELLEQYRNTLANSHPIMTRWDQSIEEVTKINNAQEMWFVKLDYTMEFEGNQEGYINGEVTFEESTPMTGEWRRSASGFIIAIDKDTALNELEPLVTGVITDIDNTVEKTIRWSEVFVKDDQQDERKFQRMDFTLSERMTRIKSAIEYTHTKQDSIASLRQSHNVSGTIWTDTKDNAISQLDAFLASITGTIPDIGGNPPMEISHTTSVISASQSTSYGGKDFLIKLDFNASWTLGLAGVTAYDLLEASMTISRFGSINQPVITPIPFGAPQAQINTGWIPGRVEISASAKAINFSTAKNWVQGKRALIANFGANAHETDQPRETATPDYAPFSDNPSALAWTFSGSYGWTFSGESLQNTWDNAL